MKVKFNPGITSDVTSYATGNGYVDGSLVRFRNGFPESVGGWTPVTSNTVTGVCRSMHEWASNAGSVRLALGTHRGCYLLSADTVYDITPQRSAIHLGTNPFSTVADATKLQVLIPYHKCAVGDTITFSGASSGVGAYAASDLNTAFTVASVVDKNNVILNGSKPSGGYGSSGGGSSVVATPNVQSGPQDAVLATGYGIGAYGTGTYGTQRTPPVSTLAPVVAQPRIWHMDNFGQDLILNPRGGGLYIWSSGGGYGARATRLDANPLASDVPLYANGVFTSVIDQNVVALGCNPLGSAQPDPMFVRWTDQQNPYNWTPTSADAAGGQRLAKGSAIVGWLPTYYETLIWTDTTVYVMQFLGNSLVYGFNAVAHGVSIISPKAAATNGSASYWLDTGSFYMYSGSVQELPCPIQNFLFKNLNRLQAWKIFAAHVHSFNEIWWFYPSVNSTEVDSYVSFNYKTGEWSKGLLSRTAWSDSGRLNTPIATDPSGNIFYHESGTDANGAPMQSWLQTGDLCIEDGDTFALLKSITPDVAFVGPGKYQELSADVSVRDSSEDAWRLQKTLIFPSTKVGEGKRDLKVRGRRVSLRYHSESLGTGWRMGAHSVEIMPNGKR